MSRGKHQRYPLPTGFHSKYDGKESHHVTWPPGTQVVHRRKRNAMDRRVDRQERVDDRRDELIFNKVAKAFDFEELKEICLMDEADFEQFGEIWTADIKDRENFFFFQDNGADILAVAHLDSVCETRMCDWADTAAGPVVFSPQLDDRLGAYIILKLLPKLGIKCDYLLTTGEETGNSTASIYKATAKLGSIKAKYNWGIEFDRKETDVVMYDYLNDAMKDLVKASGVKYVERGAFSDIACLYDLGFKCFNWGTGYRDYHGPKSHAYLIDTFTMVACFLKFYEANATTALPHVQEAFSYPKYDGKPWWKGSDYDHTDKYYRQGREGIEAPGNGESKVLNLLPPGGKEMPLTYAEAEAEYEKDRAYWAGRPTTCPECQAALVYGLCRNCKFDFWTDAHVHQDDLAKYMGALNSDTPPVNTDPTVADDPDDPDGWTPVNVVTV